MNNRKKGRSIFRYAFAGVVLIIATFAFAMASHAGSGVVNTSAIITSMLGISAVAMLTKAIRDNNAGDHTTGADDILGI